MAKCFPGSQYRHNNAFVFIVTCCRNVIALGELKTQECYGWEVLTEFLDLDLLG